MSNAEEASTHEHLKGDEEVQDRKRSFGRMGVGIYEHYKEFLPVLQDYALADRGQGFTPLVKSRTIGPSSGVEELYFKLETANPSGSYKDRFAGMALALAREAGAKTCLATSSGNTGAAVAAFAAAFGLNVYLFINELTPVGKLVQMRAHGAKLLRVKGMGLDAKETARTLERLRALSALKAIPLLVSAFAQSPEAMAGIKTIAYEVHERLGHVDHFFCPVGGGGLYVAIARGFADLACAGQGKSPRIHPVQPALNDTVVTPLNLGQARGRTVSTTTAISGLAVPFDLDGAAVITLSRACDGAGLLIQDSDATNAQRRLMLEEGLLVEPAGAVSVAGFIQAAREGRLKKDERVVCILTGHGFKDPSSLEAATEGNEIRTIGCDDIGAVLP
jgi:threonine synthase